MNKKASLDVLCYPSRTMYCMGPSPHSNVCDCRSILATREVQASLKYTDLSLCADASGEYFTLTVDFASKNHQGGIQDTEVSNGGRVQDPQQVAAIKLLLSKLNVKNDHLFQRANISFAKDVWFHNIPLGKNVLGTMMVRISEKVGLSQYYTNHSVRATAISRLSANGVEDRHIMAITGHCNAASLTSYCKPTFSQRAEWLQSSTERTYLHLGAIKLLSVQLHLIGRLFTQLMSLHGWSFRVS